MEYRKFTTTYEVWAAIRTAHPELVVFGGFCDMEGGRVQTSYGFKGGEHPIIEAYSTWDADQENPYERKNEVHNYWLCVGKED